MTPALALAYVRAITLLARLMTSMITVAQKFYHLFGCCYAEYSIAV